MVAQHSGMGFQPWCFGVRAKSPASQQQSRGPPWMSELSQPSRVDRTCLHTGFLHPSFPGTHTPTHLFIHWVSVCGSAGLQTLVNTRQAWASRAEGPVGRPCPLRLMGRRRGGGASGKGWRLQETLCRDVWGGTDTPETRDCLLYTSDAADDYLEV